MATITKKELIDRIADSTKQRRIAVKKVIQTFLDEIVDELGRDNRLEFRDFGVFETKIRKARRAQNPRKRQPVWVPERRTVKFKVGRLLKQRLDVADEADRRSSGADEDRATAAAKAAAPQEASARPRSVQGATGSAERR